jgi:hypothetical protein
MVLGRGLRLGGPSGGAPGSGLVRGGSYPVAYIIKKEIIFINDKNTQLYGYRLLPADTMNLLFIKTPENPRF